MTNKEIFQKVSFRCHRMNNFLRSYYGKPVGPYLGLNQSKYRELLDFPTPDFYHDLYNLYHYAHIEFDDNLLIDFKNAVSQSYTDKKRKS